MKFSALLVLIFLLQATLVSTAYSADRVEEVETVLTGSCLYFYRTHYRKTSKRKAFAVASDADGRQACAWRNNSMFSGPADFDALAACKKSKKKKTIAGECVVVDSDGKLVVEKGILPEWDVPAYTLPTGPAYVELHDEAMAILEGWYCQSSFRKYLQYGGHKAFAYTVSEKGVYSVCAFDGQPEPGIANDLALKKCNAKRADHVYAKRFTPECKLVSKNNEILLSREDYDMQPFEHNSLITARRLHLDTLKKYFKKGLDIDKADKRGRTVLAYSVESDRLDVVKYLLSKGADINKPAYGGETPLYKAKRWKRKDIARYLESKGAQPTSYVDTGKYTVGQVWTYKGVESSTATIVAISQHRKIGPVYHIYIDGLHIENSDMEGGIQKVIPHTAMNGKSMDDSLIEMVSTATTLPEYSQTNFKGAYVSYSFEKWKAGFPDWSPVYTGAGGVINFPISDVVRSVVHRAKR